MTVTITLAQLQSAGACSEARAAFAVTFPDGMPLDADHIAAALAHPNGVEWLEWLCGSRLCPAPLRWAYEAQVAPLRQAYIARFDQLWGTYDAQVTPLIRATLLAWGNA